MGFVLFAWIGQLEFLIPIILRRLLIFLVFVIVVVVLVHYVLHSCKGFCAAALSSNGHHDDTTVKRSKRPFGTIDYGDNWAISGLWISGPP